MSLSVAFWTRDKAQALIDLAMKAGKEASRIRQSSDMKIQTKGDGSPVTAGDMASHKIIMDGLKALTPTIPVLSEESVGSFDLKNMPACWVVDPVDGTREYVAGGPEYSVNIGLLCDGKPYLGVLYVPEMNDLVYGDPFHGAMRISGTHDTLEMLGSYSGREDDDPAPQRMPRLVTSQREAKKLPVKAWVESGDASNWRLCHSAYKFILLATGEEDIFLRTGTTYEWDTCAGHAILSAMGGCVVTPDGQELAYGKPDYRNDAFMACRPGLSAERRSFFLQKLADRPQL